jgi:hypothetical protein
MTYSTTFANVQSVTGADLDGDLNEAGRLGTIPCAVSGTNSLTLSPYSAGGTPDIGTPAIVLQSQIRFSGIAANSNSGAVTANVAGLGALTVYKDTPSGPAALTGNEIIAANYFALCYDAALNGGAGGYHLETATANAAGTVTSIATSTGLTGGTITTTGTLRLANASDKTLKSNISGGAAAPGDNTLTAILDNIMSSSQGAILARGASIWAANNETSWTPAVAFGGSSTGITYATQVGEYYAIGYLTIAMFNLVLTSKGAQTGTATLSLPSTAAGSNKIGSVVITNYNNLGSVASQPFGHIAASGTTATLYKAGTGANSALADTDFSNSTTIAGFLFFLSG